MAANASGVSAPTSAPAPGAKAPPSGAPPGSPSSLGRAAPSAPPPSTQGQRATGDSIMEAIDGEGVAPSLAHEAPKPGAQKQSPVGKPQKGGADKRAAAADAIPTGDEQAFNPEAAFMEALGPQERTQDSNPDEAPLTNDDGTPIAKSAQERFKTLAARTAQAEERSQLMEQQVGQAFQQFQQNMRQMQDHNHKLEVQLARTMERMNFLQKGQQQGQLTPEQEFERDMAQRIASPLERKLMGSMQGLQNEIKGLRETQATERRNAEIAQNKTRYNHEARYAARNMVLEGFSDEEAKGVVDIAQDYVLAKSWAKRTNAREAAKLVRSDFLKFGLAFIKAQSRINQQRRTQADQTPNAPPRSSADGSGEVEPTFDELRSAGFNGVNPFMDWDLAGRPMLTKRR